MGKAMRLPTSEEWDRLVEIAGENTMVIHWDRMYSWCDDTDPEHPAYRVVRGYRSARDRISRSEGRRFVTFGFRPVIDLPDALAPDGSRAVMGTLYMDGQPVRISRHPTWDSDITDYVPGARLELREALDDPAYQLVGIRVGDSLIADRAILKRISWEDIEAAIAQKLSQEKILGMQMLTNEVWDQMVEAADGADEAMHWQGMYSWCEGSSLCGFLSAGYKCDAGLGCRVDSVGFRPVMKTASDSLVMGTLYMDGTPVKIPQQPTWDGDITVYVPGAKLELGPALPDPAYQLMGIRAGDSLVADRAILKGISWEDIKAAIG